MQTKSLNIVLMLLLICSCKGQKECVIYNEILNNIQEHLLKNNKITIVPEEGIDPENPVFIIDTLKGTQKLNFYIVRNKQKFSIGTVKYWLSSFLNDTTLNKSHYTNDKTDSTIHCKFKFEHKFINSKDKNRLNLEDYKYRKDKNLIITYVPARILFSEILWSDKIGLVFAKTKIDGFGRLIIIYGYIFKKVNNKWEITKRNIEIR